MPSESEVSQGAALHPPAFEKAGAKLYYGVIKAWTKSFGVPLALDACRRGSAESQVCSSLRSEAELVCRGSLLLSFFNRYAFAPQKRILLKMFRRSRKLSADLKQTG